MANTNELAAELHDINKNLVKLNEMIQISTATIYRGIVSSAKIQAAQSDYERNTAIKEADDYLKQLTQESTTSP